MWCNYCRWWIFLRWAHTLRLKKTSKKTRWSKRWSVLDEAFISRVNWIFDQRVSHSFLCLSFISLLGFLVCISLPQVAWWVPSWAISINSPSVHLASCLVVVVVVMTDRPEVMQSASMCPGKPHPPPYHCRSNLELNKGGDGGELRHSIWRRTTDDTSIVSFSLSLFTSCERGWTIKLMSF